MQISIANYILITFAVDLSIRKTQKGKKMELRTQILDKARQMFWDYGLKRVSIDDICSELRISKKTFYTVFKTKNQLIEEILEIIRKNKSLKLEIENNDNIIEYLVIKSRGIRNRAKDDEKHAQMYFDLKKYYPSLFEEHFSRMRHNTGETIDQLLQVGINQGLFRPDFDFTLVKELLNIISSNLAEYGQANGIPLSRFVEFLIDVVCRIVCNDKGLDCYKSLVGENR